MRAAVVSGERAFHGARSLRVLDASHLMVFGDRGADWTPNVPDTRVVWSRLVTIHP